MSDEIRTEEREELPSSASGRGRGLLAGMRPGVTVPVGGEKPKDFRRAARLLLAYLRPHRPKIAVVVVFSIASSVFSIYAPRLMGDATTLIFNGALAKLKGVGGGMDFAAIGRICVVLLAFYVFSSVFTYLRTWVMAGVAQEIIYDLRREVSEKFNRLPLSYFDARPVGETLSRMTNDVDLISSSLQETVTQSIQALVTMVGVLVMMILISPTMTVIVAVTVPLSAWASTVISKRSRKYFRSQQKRLGQINAHIEEMYSGHVVLRAFNREERSIEDFRAMNDDLYRSGWKAQFISGIVRPVTSLISNLRYVLVAVGGGVLVVRGALQVGDILAFIKYNKQFGQPIAQMSNIVNVIQATIAAAERVFELLEAPEQEAESQNPVALVDPRGQVDFDHVSFGYVPGRTIVNDVSFTAKAGQKVAIVGPTGAGKTTLVNLLMRFYEVESGAIKVDGIDIREMTRDGLRGVFGMVLQDTWLFNGSIRDNIRYGAEGASDLEVRHAAEVAHVDHFVRTLPEGYDTVINEEASNISTGQKQLITIARAVLANPSVLILDEATSSIDTRTEQLVQSAMRRIMDGRTSFVIAHRLSTVEDADLILVMKGGDIVEQGDHEGLLAAGGIYAELYESQFAGEIAAIA